MSKTAREIQHFVPLLGIFGAGLIAFFLFSYDQKFQLAAIIATAAAYITWGIVHHIMRKDINFEVVLEYIVVAVLGVIIVWSVILRT